MSISTIDHTPQAARPNQYVREKTFPEDAVFERNYAAALEQNAKIREKMEQIRAERGTDVYVIPVEQSRRDRKEFARKADATKYRNRQYGNEYKAMKAAGAPTTQLEPRKVRKDPEIDPRELLSEAQREILDRRQEGEARIGKLQKASSGAREGNTAEELIRWDQAKASEALGGLSDRELGSLTDMAYMRGRSSLYASCRQACKGRGIKPAYAPVF